MAASSAPYLSPCQGLEATLQWRVSVEPWKTPGVCGVEVEKAGGERIGNKMQRP